MAGARIGYALTHGAQRADVSEDPAPLRHQPQRADRRAWPRSATKSSAEHVVDETARARDDYYALARELGAAIIESHTNFVCIDLETRRTRDARDERAARARRLDS